MAKKDDMGIEYYGFDEHDGVRIPQTNGCVECNMAYAEPDDFLCPNCVRYMDDKRYEIMRLQAIAFMM
jgi:hypothetical protein